MNRHEFSDLTIRRFLLAQLEPEMQSTFEESLFVDEKLERSVQFSEYQLADDYAFGRLNASERLLFEKNFVVSTARKNQLIVSGALRERLGSATLPRTSDSQILFAERLLSAFNLKRRAWKIAFVSILFLALAGTAWLVIKKEPQIKEAITKRVTGRQPAAQKTPVEMNHPTNPSTPQHENIASPPPQHEQSASSSINLTLTRDLAREKAPSIVLREGDERIVHFQMAFKNDQSTQYRAEVVSTEGKSVITGAARFASPNAINFDVPAKLLSQGEYQIKLLDGHSNALITTYYFRVQ